MKENRKQVKKIHPALRAWQILKVLETESYLAWYPATIENVVDY